ncbi:hypothetical protein [Streptomyces sp. NPDC002159]
MHKGSISKKAALVAAAAAFVSVGFAQTASAGTSEVTYHGTHAQVDTAPGNGAAGWVWVYGSKESHATGGSIEYQLKDGTTHSLTAARGETASQNTNSGIKGFRACTNSYIDGYDIKSCSTWRYFS